ncbi:acetyltransferase [Streptomyces bottropensis]|uniref:acetyltransferase n=1 Tax=Streptomyces bottropensis TaxID=42235 RepID=UPI0036B1E885
MPAGLLGDTDRAALSQRVTSAAHADPARFREPASPVRGVEPLSAHQEEFAWVVAALRVRPAG